MVIKSFGAIFLTFAFSGGAAVMFALMLSGAAGKRRDDEQANDPVTPAASRHGEMSDPSASSDAVATCASPPTLLAVDDLPLLALAPDDATARARALQEEAERDAASNGERGRARARRGPRRKPGETDEDFQPRRERIERRRKRRQNRTVSNDAA